MTIEGISTANRQLEAALANGDAASMAALYTDNGMLMPPDTPPTSGAEGIQAYWQAVIDMGVKSMALSTAELEDMGDTAVDTGTATLVIQTEDGQTVEAEGKFIVVWKQQSDGSWKLHNDCFNFDAPMG